MNNELDRKRYLNKFCFHLDHGIENKPEIGLLNIIVDKIENLNSKLNNLDRKLNYIIYHLFLVNQRLT